jgi:hypothetical protein
VSDTNNAAPTIEMVKQYFDVKGYLEPFADKYFNYYNSLNWINTKGNPMGAIWRHTAEQWMESKDAIQYKKEEDMDDYEKQEAHIKKLKEEARRWG